MSEIAFEAAIANAVDLCRERHGRGFVLCKGGGVMASGKRRLSDVLRGAFIAPRKPTVYDFGIYQTLPAKNVASPRFSFAASLLSEGNVTLSHGIIHDEVYLKSLSV